MNHTLRAGRSCGGQPPPLALQRAMSSLPPRRTDALGSATLAPSERGQRLLFRTPITTLHGPRITSFLLKCQRLSMSTNRNCWMRSCLKIIGKNWVRHTFLQMTTTGAITKRRAARIFRKSLQLTITIQGTKSSSTPTIFTPDHTQVAHRTETHRARPHGFDGGQIGNGVIKMVAMLMIQSGP